MALRACPHACWHLLDQRLLLLTSIPTFFLLAAAAGLSSSHGWTRSSRQFAVEVSGSAIVRLLRSNPDYSMLYNALLETSEMAAMARRSRKKGSAFALLAPPNGAFTPYVRECMRWTDMDMGSALVDKRKALIVQMLRYLQMANLKVPIANMYDLRSNADRRNAIQTVQGTSVIIEPVSDRLLREGVAVISSDGGRMEAFVDKVQVVDVNVSVVNILTWALLPDAVAEEVNQLCGPPLPPPVISNSSYGGANLGVTIGSANKTTS